MILNGKTGWHEMYLGGRRRPAGRALAAAAPAGGKGGAVRATVNGSLEERCAWMRERQARARKGGRRAT